MGSYSSSGRTCPSVRSSSVQSEAVHEHSSLPSCTKLHCSGVPRSSHHAPPEEHCLLQPCLDPVSSQPQQSGRGGQSAASKFSFGPSVPPFLPDCLFLGRKTCPVSRVPRPPSERTVAPSCNESTFMLPEGLSGRHFIKTHTIRPPVVCLKSREGSSALYSHPSQRISFALWSPLVLDCTF